MISCNLMGGLGNQLFQIFTTIAYSIDNNTGFSFLYQKMIGKRPSYWDNFFLLLKKYTSITLPAFNSLREKGFHFEQLPVLQQKKDVVIHGYFQSPKYFQNHIAFISETFLNLSFLKTKMLAQEFTKVEPTKTISMHFRLGDYVALKDFHPVMPLAYYKNSLKKICQPSNEKKWHIFYFCENEDISVVTNEYILHLEAEFPNCVFERANPALSDWQQMIMMSCCNHHIIANSTFSWWGAYFHFSNEKIVCYPDVWFGPKLAQNNTKDLFPEEWVKVNIL